MAINILMPKLFPDMDTGSIAEWHKAEGDEVQKGEVIAQIETDKAVTDLEAPESGIIGKILVEGGTSEVEVETPIATIVQPGESDDETPDVTQTASSVEPAPQLPPNTGGRSKQRPTTGRIKASPAARHLAASQHIDLTALSGRGPKGRIIKADVLEAIDSLHAANQSADLVNMPASDLPPLSAMRRTIASRMVESKQQIPHAYISVDCRMDELIDLRKRINSRSREKDGVGRISINDFVIRAAALSLKRHPEVNVSWSDDGIEQHSNINVAVAVATTAGLITPVIRNADLLTVSEVSRQIRDLASRAEAGGLGPTEYRSGTLTVTNLGMYGVKQFFAIINPPQSCILAVGAVEERPIVVNSQLAVGLVMTCTVAIDHRSMDGVIGAELLRTFKEYLEDPESLLL